MIRERLRQLQYLLNRKKIRRELEEELESHRAQMGERAATFGSNLKLREDANDSWGFGWLDRLWQDVHYGGRILRKTPAFTLTAIAILALGIGLNVSAFTFFDVAVLRPLPVKDPATIVRVLRAAPGSRADNMSYPAFRFYQLHNRVFSAMWAIAGGELALESGEKVSVRFVTPDFFREMGGVPAEGRFLSSGDAPGAAVISDRFRQRNFAGEALGSRIRLGRATAAVIGVAPASFVSVEPWRIDLWLPISDYAFYNPNSKLLTDTDMQPLIVYGRLAPGISPAAAEAGLRPLVDAYRPESPKEVWKDEYLSLEPGAYLRLMDPRLKAFLAVPGLLLLLVLAAACANLGNLLLARGATRAREISIRTAAGASRGRIIRQLLTESVMLALLGAAVSVPLSIVAVQAYARITGAPDGLAFTPDWRIVVFALMVALVAAILFGLAPAMQLAKPNEKRASRTRLILIACQVAASCVLIILSSLMTRGLERALQLNPGFSFEQSANVYLDAGTVGIHGPAASLLLERYRARMAQIPGVESICLSILPPFGNRFSGMNHAVGFITTHAVDAEYFKTMEIPILEGRTFVHGDPDENIVIGERLARKLWPGGSALGKEFPNPDAKTHWTVVGVAGDAPVTGFGDSDAMELYHPLSATNTEHANLIVRTRNIDSTVKAIQQVADGVDPAITPSVVPMRQGYEQRLKGGRIAAWSVAALGAVALLLALVGLAGLISYAVTQRTKEIGIRMALGAGRAEALRVGVSQLLMPVLIGMAIGVAGATGIAQMLRSVLYGLSTVDPLAYAGSLAVFVVLVGLAAIAPLQRAMRVDPATALRHD